MTTPTPQTITRCNAGRGWLWWMEAFRMVKDAMAPWYWIGAGYIGLFIIPSLILSGGAATDPRMSFLAYLPTIIAPCFVVGFVAAGWSQARGETPHFSHLFNGFRSDVKTLLGIGVVTMVLAWLSARAGSAVLGEELKSVLASIDKGQQQDPMAILSLLTAPRFMAAALVYAGLLSLIWMATWLAPMVVVFQHTGVAAAMLSSLRALSVNWRALSVYVLVPIIAGIALSIVLGFVMAILALVVLGSGGAVILSVLLWGLILPILPLFISMGSLTAFVAYCDIFHAKDGVFPRTSKVSAT